jgi:hypothetical protein
MDNEFYIGWMPSAPSSFSKHTRKVIIILAGAIITITVLLSLEQKKFSTASFEFGSLTEVTGIYQRFPVPSIRVMTERDAFGNSSFITIPLVGYGKFGAEGTIDFLEKQYQIQLNNRKVTFRGALLYSDGKTLLQIDQHDDPLVEHSEPGPGVIEHDSTDLGNVELTGEILDPKCYFGVMKPGHGKPHKDCAIRCIAGGMSPVFYVRNEKGEANYYLILDSEGRKMNDQLKDHIAEPLSLRARAVKYDDWVILYTNSETIKATGGLSWFKTNDGTISCRAPRN